MEVAPAPVVAEWRGAEVLGLTLGRDLRIEEVEPSVGEPQLLEAVWIDVNAETCAVCV